VTLHECSSEFRIVKFHSFIHVVACGLKAMLAQVVDAPSSMFSRTVSLDEPSTKQLDCWKYEYDCDRGEYQ
jgi:hypothetical protein